MFAIHLSSAMWLSMNSLSAGNQQHSFSLVTASIMQQNFLLQKFIDANQFIVVLFQPLNQLGQ